MIFVALNPRFKIGFDVPAPKQGRVQWRYRDGSRSGHGNWISLAVAETAAAECNAEWPQISHWVKLR